MSDGLGNSYTYDALGQISSDGGTSYVYDASGNRVSKNNGTETDTIYFGGRPLARFAGTWTDLIYGPNGLLAEVPGGAQSSSPIYRMVDHLGSSVGMISSTGAVLSTQDVAPFGQIFAGGTGDTYQFTGKERDAESGLDYFGARYYGSSMGRFLSPDWSSSPEPVPYANLADPQSLNLYSYARNNPLVHIDADGHCWSIFQAACDFFKSVVNEVRYREFTPDSRLANIRSLDRAERRDRQAVTAAMAGVTRRLSSAQLRALWERNNPGQKVPFDEVRGRFYDMDHIKALADGGIEDDPANLQPLERGAHMAKHAGDWPRWGARAADAAKEAGEVIKSSAEDAGEAIKDAATEVVNNPGEALQDAAEAVESGEILPP